MTTYEYENPYAEAYDGGDVAGYVWRVDTKNRVVTFDGYEIEVWRGQTRLLRTNLAELRSIGYRTPRRSWPGALRLDTGRQSSANTVPFTTAQRAGMDALVLALRQAGVQIADRAPKVQAPPWFLAAAGLAGLAVALVWTLSPSQPSAPGASDAITKCERKIRDQLKAPSTAEFSSVRYTGTSPKWVVRGDVDAQNSFGAMLRSSWLCTATVNGDGSWSVDAAVIE